jgi:hypothetical protein
MPVDTNGAPSDEFSLNLVLKITNFSSASYSAKLSLLFSIAYLNRSSVRIAWRSAATLAVISRAVPR